jgi:hypothetical protein
MSSFWSAVFYGAGLVCFAFEALEINRVRKPFHWIAIGLFMVTVPFFWTAAQTAAR